MTAVSSERDVLWSEVQQLHGKVQSLEDHAQGLVSDLQSKDQSCDLISQQLKDTQLKMAQQVG